MAQVYSVGPVPVPDQTVTDTENAIQKVTADSLCLTELKLNGDFPYRPGYGTRGTPVTLWANYFQMLPTDGLILYRYDISVQPTAVGRKLNQVIRLLLETPEFSALRQHIVTDFKSTLISRQRSKKDDITFRVQYRSELQDEPQQGATRYVVRLQYTNTLSVAELLEYLTSTNPSARFEDRQTIIQAFNIFLNHYSKSNPKLITIGAHRTFFLGPDSDTCSLGGGLTAIRGFFSSVRMATSRILVNVNINHSAFYNAVRLDQLIQQKGGSCYSLDVFLTKVRVRTTYLPEEKNKAGQTVYKIKTICGLATRNDGIKLEHRPRVKRDGAGPKDVEFWLRKQSQSSSISAGGPTFETKKIDGKPSGTVSDGEYVSVYDFFKKTYRITGNPSTSVVNVGSVENPIYLPAEVCIVMPGQRCPGQLESIQTTKMIQFAARRPRENANSIVSQGFRMVGLSQENLFLKNYGVSVPHNLITVRGRVRDDPKIIYRNKKSASVRSGSWNLVNLQFNTSGKTLEKWSALLIKIPGQPQAFDLKSLDIEMKELQQTLLALGIRAEPPQPVQEITIEGAQDPALDEKVKRASAKLELLLMILPTKNRLYDKIKYLGDVTDGIHTPCCIGEKLAKRQPQYRANIASKINGRLGGTNHIVGSPALDIINEDKTMVLGLDVTHPSPTSDINVPSIAGMVASVSSSLTQWPGILRVQPSARKEEVVDPYEMLKFNLKLWRTQHTAYPENILLYRDGVSEGQFAKVISEELPQLRRACKELYPASEQTHDRPRFTIINAAKRHHTRFYPTSGSGADSTSNTKPGTVVDRGVTEARTWDFYLQPHCAIKGTARPTHYTVLIDEIFHHHYKANKLPKPYKNVADVVENLTLAMSYTFGRATKAVGLCTPAKYADLLCDRARRHVNHLFEAAGEKEKATLQITNEHLQIHPNLRDTMFYI